MNKSMLGQPGRRGRVGEALGGNIQMDMQYEKINCII